MGHLYRLTAAAILTCLVTASAHASDATDLKTISCKDIMRASGGDRDISIGFLQGYLLGLSGKTAFDSEAVGEATDALIEECLDHPTKIALDVLKQVSK